MTQADLQARLDAIEAFMQTVGYTCIQNTFKKDLRLVGESIVALVPVSDEDRNRLLLLHGEKSQLESNLKLFEDARDTLKTAIDDLIDADIKVAIDQLEDEENVNETV